jgi:hypothetical protein
VEHYRLTHGHWPDSMPVLVPEFIRQLPSDPFDGKALHFHRLDDGVVIYSIGPDGKDNGGKMDRTDLQTPDTNIGFQLWDVNRRRQPWRPPPKRTDDDNK